MRPLCGPNADADDLPELFVLGEHGHAAPQFSRRQFRLAGRKETIDARFMSASRANTVRLMSSARIRARNFCRSFASISPRPYQQNRFADRERIGNLSRGNLCYRGLGAVSLVAARKPSAPPAKRLRMVFGS